MTSDASSHDGGPMPAPHLDPLPFRRVDLTGSWMERLESVIARWSAQYRLGDRLHAEVIRQYTRFCAPFEPSMTGIDLAVEYLLWFFTVDDLPDDARRIPMLNEVRQVLAGANGESNALLCATVGLRDRLIDRLAGNDTRRLFQAFDGLLASCIWEAERAGQIPSVEQYWRNRAHTIAGYPYLELFRLTENARTSPAIEELTHLCVEVIWVTNDILSVKRDVRKGDHNLVVSLAGEERISYAAACARAVHLLYESIAAFQVRQDRILADDSLDANTRRHVDFLGTILAGNRMATMSLAERYLGNG